MFGCCRERLHVNHSWELKGKGGSVFHVLKLHQLVHMFGIYVMSSIG